MTIIAQAQETDHDALVKLAKKSTYTKDFSNRVMFSTPAAYEKGWILKAVSHGHSGLLDGTILGMICIRSKVREPKTVVYFLIVDETARGLGIGKALIEAAQEAGEHRTVELNVMKGNNDALEFYKKLGFEIVGGAINNTAWKLEKTF